MSDTSPTEGPPTPSNAPFGAWEKAKAALFGSTEQEKKDAQSLSDDLGTVRRHLQRLLDWVTESPPHDRLARMGTVSWVKGVWSDYIHDSVIARDSRSQRSFGMSMQRNIAVLICIVLAGAWGADEYLLERAGQATTAVAEGVEKVTKAAGLIDDDDDADPTDDIKPLMSETPVYELHDAAESGDSGGL